MKTFQENYNTGSGAMMSLDRRLLLAFVNRRM
jgi:hypothetical protein